MTEKEFYNSTTADIRHRIRGYWENEYHEMGKIAIIVKALTGEDLDRDKMFNEVLPSKKKINQEEALAEQQRLVAEARRRMKQKEKSSGG